MNSEPDIRVGILSAPCIEFTLPTTYLFNGQELSGAQKAEYANGHILLNGQLYNELWFEPKNAANSFFELHHVTIGIGFHWQRDESQRFQGTLHIIIEKEKLTAINIIPAEAYLSSVISSEMNATAPEELLKAHAVISRSWLLATRNTSSPLLPEKNAQEKSEEGGGLVWYERDAHTRFDVCADDHCQRYQGITRASTEQVRQAVADTCGEVLMYENKICDARFSKCCGGAFEEFQYCWSNRLHPYLHRGRDWKTGQKTSLFPDLTIEKEAERWIRTAPPAFCHTTDRHILARVLNNYDQETPDFYRWRVEYTQEELANVIQERSGLNYGAIIALVPIARGTSGRLWQLKIIGTQLTRTIGKELEIRRTLSPTHLYSSAFVVDKEDYRPDGLPGRFILTGAGWGHGVGLCQIGAAIMATQGYSYRDILQHYYAGARIERIYNHSKTE